MGSPVVRWQMLSSQPDATAGFYHQLFGWTLTQDNALGYRELKSGDRRGIDGGVWPAPPHAPGFVQLFIEVPNIDACLENATGLGARILVPKSVLPDGDVMAVLLDPTGISFGVVSHKS